MSADDPHGSRIVETAGAPLDADLGRLSNRRVGTRPRPSLESEPDSFW